MVEETLETLAIREKKNALRHNTIKTYSAAITMLALAGSTIGGGLGYAFEMIKERAALRAEKEQKYRLDLTGEAITHIDKFLRIDRSLNHKVIVNEQIVPAILLRGLGEPGAMVINDIIKKAENEEIAQLLAHSYSNVALSTKDSLNYLAMNVDRLHTNWIYIRSSLNSTTIKEFRMQLVAFQFIAPPILKMEHEDDEERLSKIKNQFDSIYDDMKNPEICKAESGDCDTIKTNTQKCLDLINALGGLVS